MENLLERGCSIGDNAVGMTSGGLRVQTYQIT